MTKHSKKIILGLVASMTLVGTAMAKDDKVYATVNGEKITQSDISALIRDQRVTFDTLPKEQKDQILNSLVEQKLLTQAALKTNILKTKEYKEELEKFKKTLAFQIFLRDFSKKLEIKDAEAKKFYDKNKFRFKAPMQLSASHILVKTEKEAKDIIKTLSKSSKLKEDFTKLAKEKSVGPSSSNGGELGWFTKEKMVPEFSEAALKLKKGTITKTPVKTNYGFHVIYLDDKKEAATIAYDKVKKRLMQELLQKKFAEEIKKKAEALKKKAKIEYK